jgi:hypothetical protein
MSKKMDHEMMQAILSGNGMGINKENKVNWMRTAPAASVLYEWL